MPIVVSPGGSVPSLAAAVELLRKKPGDRTVIVSPGRYPDSPPVALDARDRGLRIFGRGRPVLLGGPDLRAVSTEGGVAVYALPFGPAPLTRRGFGVDGTPGPTELFRDGRPFRLAASPDWSNYGAARSTDGGFEVEIPDAGLAAALREPGAMALGYWAFDWADGTEPVRPREGNRFFLPGPFPFGMKDGRRFRVVGARSQMDEPGEYWVDPTARRAYLRLAPGETAPVVTASREDRPLISAAGTADLRIEGLSLEAGRGEALSFRDCDHLRAKGLLVRGFGRGGMFLGGGRDARVETCDFEDLGEGGIYVDAGDRKTLTPARHVLRDLRLRRYARWCRTYRPGVSANGVGVSFVRSEVTDAPHQGAAFSGNDHLFEGVEFRRLMRETGDSGAIYSGRNPTWRGTRIAGCLFTEIAPPTSTPSEFHDVMGVYLDDCLPGTTVERNAFVGPFRGIMVGGGRDNLVADNYFEGTPVAISVDARARGWAKGYFEAKEGGWNFFGPLAEMRVTEPPYSVHYPTLATFEGDDPSAPKGNRLLRNFLKTPADVDVRETRPGEVEVVPGVRPDPRLPRPYGRAEVGLVTRRGRPGDAG